jgi:hypothetical protein
MFTIGEDDVRPYLPEGVQARVIFGGVVGAHPLTRAGPLYVFWAVAAKYRIYVVADHAIFELGASRVWRWRATGLVRKLPRHTAVSFDPGPRVAWAPLQLAGQRIWIPRNFWEDVSRALGMLTQ